MTSKLDWDDLRVFLAVARAGNLTQAARSLKVSQPTVGRRLRTLEDDLGTKLFERRPNELALTPAGQKLVPIAEQMERESFELSRVIEEQFRGTEEPVRVTAIGSVALFLTRHFDAIAAHCGPCDIELISTGERLSLARNEADIALRMGRLPRKGNLISRKVGQIAYALYASTDLIDRMDLRTEAEFRRAPFIGHRKNPKRPSQSRWVHEFGQSGTFPLRANDLHLRYEAAKCGHGVALLPCHLADNCATLKRMLRPPTELIEDIYLLIHPEMREVPRVRRVADALIHLIDEKQSELLGV